MNQRITCASIAALLLVGCRGFEPATADTLARVGPMPLAAQLVDPDGSSGRFVLELESAALAGVFDVVFAADERALRLQLFPDVGGKVLDVTVGPDTIDATSPDGDYHARAPLDDAEPHLALVLAATMAELLAPVDGRRVLGQRPTAGPAQEVRLRPALGAGEVVASLDEDGAVRGYRIGLGWLDFRLGADGRLAGPGFVGRLCP